MKKAWSIGVTLCVLLLGLCGCQPQFDPKAAAQNQLKIGVIQTADHDALDVAYDSFVSTLIKNGMAPSVEVDLDYQVARGDLASCQAIAEQFVSEDKDMIVALGTPAAQAAAAKTEEIPILVVAVTDPFSAQLVNSNDIPGRNVTGTSDYTPVAEQLSLLKQAMPKAKTVALLHNPREDNSAYQVQVARQQAALLGLETVDATVYEENEIEPAIRKAAERADVIYIPTDNSLALHIDDVAEVAKEAAVPTVCGDTYMVNAGGLMTVGVDYSAVGQKAALQAVRILRDGADISKMPIEYPAERKLKLEMNVQTAQDIKMTFPRAFLDSIKDELS